VWLDFKKDALIDRWRLYKIAHKQEDDYGVIRNVSGACILLRFSDAPSHIRT
jgi:hypothetical protein